MELKEGYDSIDEIREDLDNQGRKEDRIIVSQNFLYIEKQELDEKPDYEPLYIRKDKKWIRISGIDLQTKIAEQLVDKVDPKKIILYALKRLTPEEIEDIYERVVEKKGKVYEGEGCYSLFIGGKRGATKPFVIVE